MVMYSRILLHKASVRVGGGGGGGGRQTQQVLYREVPPRGLTLYRSIYHFCQSGASLYKTFWVPPHYKEYARGSVVGFVID